MNWSLDCIIKDGGITAREIGIISEEISCPHLLNYISVYGLSMTSKSKDIGALVCLDSPNVHSYLTPQGANKVDLLTYLLTHLLIYTYSLTLTRYYNDTVVTL